MLAVARRHLGLVLAAGLLVSGPRGTLSAAPLSRGRAAAPSRALSRTLPAGPATLPSLLPSLPQLKAPLASNLSLPPIPAARAAGAKSFSAAAPAPAALLLPTPRAASSPAKAGEDIRVSFSRIALGREALARDTRLGSQAAMAGAGRSFDGSAPRPALAASLPPSLFPVASGTRAPLLRRTHKPKENDSVPPSAPPSPSPKRVKLWHKLALAAALIASATFTALKLLPPLWAWHEIALAFTGLFLAGYGAYRLFTSRLKLWIKIGVTVAVLGTAGFLAFKLLPPKIEPVQPPPTQETEELLPIRLEKDKASFMERFAEGDAAEFRLVGHKTPLLAVAISRDRRLVLTSSEDGAWRLWDMTSGTAYAPRLETGRILGAAFGEGDRKLILLGEDASVRILHLASGEPRILSSRLITQSIGGIRLFSFSPDAKRLAMVSKSGRLHVLDIVSAKGRAFDGNGTPLALSSTETEDLLLAYRNNIATLWSFPAAGSYGKFKEQYVPGLELIDGSSSKDGKVLLAVGKLGRAQAAVHWPLSQAEPDMLMAAEIGEEGAELLGIAGSPDGNLAALMTQGRGLWLWDVKTGAALPISADAAGRKPFFSDDGTAVLASASDGAVYSWRLSALTPEPGK